jgi:hypothetical protein
MGDPLEGSVDLPISRAAYAYANADPVSRTDPSGKDTLAEISAALSIQATLFQAALPTIVFGSVELAATAVIAPALKRAASLRQCALETIADPIDPKQAELAFATYEYATSVLAFGLGLLSAGLGIISTTQKWTAVGLSIANVGRAIFGLATSVRTSPSLASALEEVGRTLSKVRRPDELLAVQQELASAEMHLEELLPTATTAELEGAGMLVVRSVKLSEDVARALQKGAKAPIPPLPTQRPDSLNC